MWKKYIESYTERYCQNKAYFHYYFLLFTQKEFHKTLVNILRSPPDIFIKIYESCPSSSIHVDIMNDQTKHISISNKFYGSMNFSHRNTLLK